MAINGEPLGIDLNVVKLAKRMVRVNEGIRLFPYKDSLGILTIGIGRNLEAKGISESEAMLMLNNDLHEAATAVKQKVPFFENLDYVRQSILIDMAFNLGINGLLKFKKALAAMESGEWGTAAAEMKDSQWHNQVGLRAVRLETMMQTGEILPIYEGEENVE